MTLNRNKYIQPKSGAAKNQFDSDKSIKPVSIIPAHPAQNLFCHHTSYGNETLKSFEKTLH
jgi:hypothetical protein